MEDEGLNKPQFSEVRPNPVSSAGLHSAYHFWTVCSCCTDTPKQNHLVYLSSTAHANELPLALSILSAI